MNLSCQYIKAISMNIAKTIIILLILLTNLSCNKMDKQDFKVYGDTLLLKECKINIIKINESGVATKQTLLYNGKQFLVESESEIAEAYTVYFSYKDSLINVLKYENIFRNTNDQVNHFYFAKNKGTISVKFVGRRDDLKNKQGFTTTLIPFDEYQKRNTIDEQKDKEEIKQLFFTLYKK